jgi:hypothetical protein
MRAPLIRAGKLIHQTPWSREINPSNQMRKCGQTFGRTFGRTFGQTFGHTF